MSKSLIPALLLLGLSGCSSLAFDALQYDRLITVSEQADEMAKSCQDTAYMTAQSKQLLAHVSHMKNYATHRSVSPEIATSIATLYSLSAELNSKYATGEAPSVIYCQQKLKTISTTSTAISDTIGRLN